MPRLTDRLDSLHQNYAEAINNAVAEDNLGLANRLAAHYDEDAIALIAEHEGLTHKLPINRPVRDSGLRSFARRLTARRAA